MKIKNVLVYTISPIIGSLTMYLINYYAFDKKDLGQVFFVGVVLFFINYLVIKNHNRKKQQKHIE